MASEDFKRLMNFLFNDKKRIENITVELSQNDDECVKIEFTGGLVYKTQEPDAIDYALSIRQRLDSDGNYRLVHYKDLEKYYDEAKFLADEDNQKLHQASRDLLSGKFGFNYDPDELQKEFISSSNRSLKKYEKLKTDYYYIAAYRISEAKAALALLHKFEANDKGVNIDYKIIDKLLRDAFRPDGNFIKNYLSQKVTSTFDLYDFLMQATAAIGHTSDLLSYYPKQGMDGEKGVKVALDMYRRYAEACVQPLNLLRIAHEIVGGNLAPESTKGAVANKTVLSPTLGSMLDCYNPHIRNSESHLSTRVDPAKKKVTISNKGVKVAEYTYQEVLDLTNTIGNRFLPALVCALTLQLTTVLLVISLQSPEYKIALLGIGNT